MSSVKKHISMISPLWWIAYCTTYSLLGWCGADNKLWSCETQDLGYGVRQRIFWLLHCRSNIIVMLKLKDKPHCTTHFYWNEIKYPLDFTQTHTHIFPIIIQSSSCARSWMLSIPVLIHPTLLPFLPVVEQRWSHLTVNQSKNDCQHSLSVNVGVHSARRVNNREYKLAFHQLLQDSGLNYFFVVVLVSFVGGQPVISPVYFLSDSSWWCDSL